MLVFAPLTVAVILAALVALPLALSLPWSPLDHFECRAGPVLVTQRLWTPLGLVNSPYGGNGSIVVQEPSAGQWSFSSRNGGSEGLFTLMNWSISAPVRTLVAGPGVNAACPEFIATHGPHASFTTADILAENSTSDAAERTTVTLNSPEGVFDSVVFQNGYAAADGSRMTTCMTLGGTTAVTSSHITVQVPFLWDGTRHAVPATLNYAAAYSYEFPGGMGTWSVDDLNIGSDAPGGGLAFSFVSCA